MLSEQAKKLLKSNDTMQNSNIIVFFYHPARLAPLRESGNCRETHVLCFRIDWFSFTLGIELFFLRLIHTPMTPLTINTFRRAMFSYRSHIVRTFSYHDINSMQQRAGGERSPLLIGPGKSIFTSPHPTNAPIQYTHQGHVNTIYSKQIPYPYIIRRICRMNNTD